MSRPVRDADIDGTSPQLLAVSGTAVTLSDTRLGKARRIFLSIIPITAGITVTVVLGDISPAVGQGIQLSQTQPFVQSDDANGKGTFQGTVQAIASGGGYVAMTEIFQK